MKQARYRYSKSSHTLHTLNATGHGYIYLARNYRVEIKLEMIEGLVPREADRVDIP